MYIKETHAIVIIISGKKKEEEEEGDIDILVTNMYVSYDWYYYH